MLAIRVVGTGHRPAIVGGRGGVPRRCQQVERRFAVNTPKRGQQIRSSDGSSMCGVVCVLFAVRCCRHAHHRKVYVRTYVCMYVCKYIMYM